MTRLHWLSPGFGLMTAPGSMDSVYEQFFGYGSTSQEDGTPTHSLPVDILETEDAYELRATVAGAPENGVEVTFADGMLSLTVKAAPLPAKGKLVRQERPWGNWVRKLELPKEIDTTSIGAQFDNGVLTVRVAKAAKAEPVHIAIHPTHTPTSVTVES